MTPGELVAWLDARADEARNDADNPYVDDNQYWFSVGKWYGYASAARKIQEELGFV